MKPGDYNGWHDAYLATADRLATEASAAHPVTERDLLLRASTYYLSAGFFSCTATPPTRASPTRTTVVSTLSDVPRGCSSRSKSLVRRRVYTITSTAHQEKDKNLY